MVMTAALMTLDYSQLLGKVQTSTGISFLKYLLVWDMALSKLSPLTLKLILNKDTVMSK